MGDEEIIMAVRSRYPDVLEEGGLCGQDGGVFSSLAGRLVKPVWQIRQRWYREIEHVLTRQQHRISLDEDFKAKLLDYMVHNSLKDWKDVKWDEVARQPEFLGSTARYLKQQADGLTDGARKKLNKERSKVTVEEMREWYTSSGKQAKQAKIRERENHYINVWFG